MDERGRLRTLHLLARLGRATPEEILAFRDAQLHRLVSHAGERVPYYRRRFEEHGVRPGDIRTLADLARVPMTGRRELQAAAPGDVLERGTDPRRLVSRATTGSTGRPLTLYRSWAETQMGTALRLRMLHDLGVRLSDRRAGILVLRAPQPRHRGLARRAVRALGVFRKALFDVRMPLPALLEELRRWRPDVVMGYPSVLAQLALLVTDEVRAHLRPRMVLSGAEMLTPLAREQIARGFGAEVRDWYGSHEAGMMGWQCASTGLFHVAEHGVILEVLADGRPVAVGEAGEVVTTSLHWFAMPIIRYRLGDLVVRGPAPCPCGAPFSTIGAIEGRTRDIFWLANGRAVHPNLLNRIVETIGRTWTRQYQLVQEQRSRVLLRLAPLATPPPADLARIHEAMSEILGPGTEVEIQLVADLEPEPDGKFRQIRSLVAAGDASELREGAVPAGEAGRAGP